MKHKKLNGHNEKIQFIRSTVVSKSVTNKSTVRHLNYVKFLVASTVVNMSLSSDNTMHHAATTDSMRSPATLDLMNRNQQK